ncbi:MAG: hypothetical protein P8098_15510 [Candidatus Thiodiazotropha sp.]
MAGAGKTLILIAHERKLPELVKLMKSQRHVFAAYRLLATSETGEAIERELGLEVTHLFSGRNTNMVTAVALTHWLGRKLQPAVGRPDREATA